MLEVGVKLCDLVNYTVTYRPTELGCNMYALSSTSPQGHNSVLSLKDLHMYVQNEAIFYFSGFFWLLSLLLSSILWFAVVPLRDKLAFGLVFSVLFQELFRFLFYKLLR